MLEQRLVVITVIVAALASEAWSAPPRILRQGHAIADSTAASGSRTSFAMLRMPDGSFAFYDRNQPQAGPLQPCWHSHPCFRSQLKYPVVQLLHAPW